MGCFKTAHYRELGWVDRDNEMAGSHFSPVLHWPDARRNARHTRQWWEFDFSCAKVELFLNRLEALSLGAQHLFAVTRS